MSNYAYEHTTDPIATRSTLIRAVADRQDDGAWQEFDRTYRKLIHGMARHCGLTPDEAEEATQETLIAVSQAIGKFHYDPKQCSFKTWLGSLAKNKVNDQLRKRPPRGRFTDPPSVPSTLTDPIARLPDPASLDPDAFWTAEYEEIVQGAALAVLKKQVRNPLHYQIFHLHVGYRQPAQEVANALGTSPGQVYLVKLRLMRRFKRIVAGLQKQPL